MVNIQAPVLCECIDTRIGTISRAGGVKPIFIMQLHNETIDEPLIKYFNCNLSNAGYYSVPHNDEMVTSRRQSGDGETLDDANSLGLDAVFHPINKRPNQGKTINTQDHVCDAKLFVNLTDTAQGFYNERLNVLLKNLGFKSPEAESVAMRDNEIKFGQTAFLLNPVSLQTHDEWLAAFNGMEQAT